MKISNLEAEYHIYECQGCCLGFAVEVNADQSHIVCPDCQSEDLRDVGTGTMIITSIAKEKDPAGTES